MNVNLEDFFGCLLTWKMEPQILGNQGTYRDGA